MKLNRLKMVNFPPQKAPKKYKNFSIRPISGALGGEVEGFNINNFDESSVEELKMALSDHLFLVFRKQDLVPKTMLEFSQRFGKPMPHNFWKGMEGSPEVFELKTDPDAEMAYGSVWHTDLTCNPQPPKGNLLYCAKAPVVGGDTLFSNMYLAYQNLSPGYQAILKSQQVEHRSQFVVHPKKRQSNDGDTQDQAPVVERSRHPAIISHPVTGEDVLYVNRVFTEKFSEMSIEESQPLLEYLFSHCARPEFTGRVRWEAGTLCLWDNYSTQHHAVGDYRGQERIMWRVTLEGQSLSPESSRL